MGVNTIKRFWSGLIITLLISAAALIFGGAIALSRTTDSDFRILTGGYVGESQCSFCHKDLDAFKNPRLIFSHKLHFDKGARCQACHLEFPHAPGQTTRPSMDSCFNCHGQIHGSQGQVAKKDCAVCHPTGFNRLPDEHTPDWKASAHKRNKDQNRCLMCHTGSQCEDCHRRTSVKPKPVESYVYKGFYPKVEVVKQIIDLAVPASITQCDPCHASWDLSRDPNVIFSHAFHLIFRCQACHQVFPHQPQGLVKPTMESCYACHGLRHGNQGEIAKRDCSICHPPAFNRVPVDHTPEWKTSTHKNDNPVRCWMCHEVGWCDQCHVNRGVKAMAAPPVIPDYGIAYAFPAKVEFKPPEASLDCLPCHSSQGKSKNPDLIFEHTWHLTIRCQACHLEFPHAPGQTTRPSMDSCFNCHGQIHGSQGQVAKKDCAVCHPTGFNRLPDEHTPDWKASAHKRNKDQNRCLMCHTGSQCEDCHRRTSVKPKPAESYVYKGFYPKAQATKQIIDLAVPASITQCDPCHASWDLSRDPNVIFSHAFHLLVRCQACHQVFPHQPQGLVKPTMESCYACHGLRHGSKGLVAREECSVCHPPDFSLMPPAHTPEFIAGEHKTVAVEQRAYCSMCHKEEFCQTCHTNRKVIPQDHQSPEWRTAHGRRGVVEESKYCSVCHGESFCNNCHKTPMPHPPLWLGEHQQAGRGNRDDCMICHRRDWQQCNNCHHPDMKAEILVFDRCIRCHPDYNKDKQQLMVNSNLLIHKVHFAEYGVIGKTVAGPFKCNKCHPILAAPGCYDFEGLCYKCHGARDQYGKEIAPYGRGVLCTRCHPQLLQRGTPRGGL